MEIKRRINKFIFGNEYPTFSEKRDFFLFIPFFILFLGFVIFGFLYRTFSLLLRNNNEVASFWILISYIAFFIWIFIIKTEHKKEIKKEEDHRKCAEKNEEFFRNKIIDLEEEIKQLSNYIE